MDKLFSMGFGFDDNGDAKVIFVIAEGSRMRSGDGSSAPGIGLTPSQAKEAAYALLLHAQQLENGCSVGKTFYQAAGCSNGE
jgi:hypothetical protein